MKTFAEDPCMRVLCIFLPKGNEKMKIRKNFVTAGKEYTTYANAVAAPLFKLCFDYNKSGESPFLEISALGFYDAYINGVKITKGMLAPYISNPELPERGICPKTVMKG